jgi:hypothetical protein
MFNFAVVDVITAAAFFIDTVALVMLSFFAASLYRDERYLHIFVHVAAIGVNGNARSAGEHREA